MKGKEAPIAQRQREVRLEVTCHRHNALTSEQAVWQSHNCTYVKEEMRCCFNVYLADVKIRYIR